MRRSTLKRILWALLVAAVLALAFADIKAQEDDPCGEFEGDYEACAVMLYPSICRHLEPWTYWWGFFGCEHAQIEGRMASEEVVGGSLLVATSDDETVVRATRKLRGGSVERLEIRRPRRVR